MDNYDESNNNNFTSTPSSPPTPAQIQQQYQQSPVQPPSQSTISAQAQHSASSLDQNPKNSSKLILILIIIVIASFTIIPVVLALWTYFAHDLAQDVLDPTKTFDPTTHYGAKTTDSFEFNFIKTANTDKSENYLISPYSIKSALQLLHEGAAGETKSEIESVLKGDTTPLNLSSSNLKVANAAFIAPRFSESIKPDFTNLLATKYNSEILSADSSDVINNWVNEKTDGMIPKIIDSLPPDFALGLSNAISLDAKWKSEFEPELTTEKIFTTSEGDEVETDIMTKTSTTAETSYFELSDGKGITKSYSTESKDCDDTQDSSLADSCSSRQFEFIAILPNSSPDDFINNMSSDLLSEIDSKKIPGSEDVNIITHLPKFTFDYKLDSFKDNLESLGIDSAFVPELADFANITNEQVYVGSAIHKTHIELDESSTKAAAVTYFEMIANSSANTPETQPTIYEISFDQPFLFFIRDIESNEAIFFGVIEDPSA